MKKIFLITVCCAILLAVSPIAYSADGPYVSGNVGLALVPNMKLVDRVVNPSPPNVFLETSSGFAYGAAIGIRVLDNFRIEEEITRQKNDIDTENGVAVDGDVTSTLILLNGYYDFPYESAFRPFLTGGIGFASIKTQIPTGRPLAVNAQDGVLAYQVGIGIGYAINDKVTFDYKYRYQGCAHGKYNTSQVYYSSHNFYIGIRYAF